MVSSANSQRKLLALNAISEAVNRSLDLDAVLTHALDCVLDVLELDSGDIRLVEEGRLVLRSARGVSPVFLEAEEDTPLGRCQCGRAAQHGDVLIVEDLSRAPNLDRSACACERFGAVISVPVQTTERVVGLLHAASRAPRRFDSDDRELLAAVGHQIGVAIEKAQLHARLRQLNRELEARVEARTRELAEAQEALAEKAGALHEMLAEERRIEERTRARIAHDLHDGVQQLIIGALFEVQAAREVLVSQPQTALARLNATQELLRRIEGEMRGAIYSLRPVALDAHGLVPALRECASAVERTSGVGCRLLVEGPARRFDPDAEVAAFRIVQEALNNAEAHARASALRVSVRFAPRTLQLEVMDDGVGFDMDAVAERPRSHLGLIGMQERAESVGGELTIWSNPGTGTRLNLRIPLEEDRHSE